MADMQENYHITQEYVTHRDTLVLTLEAFGYSSSRMGSGESLADSILVFLQKLSATNPKSAAELNQEFQNLLPLRWECIMGWHPVLESFLRNKHYQGFDDPDGEIMLEMEKALEQAIDRVQGVREDYIRQWLRSRWQSLMQSKYGVPAEIRKQDPSQPKWSKQFTKEVPLTIMANGDEVNLYEPVDEVTPERSYINATAPDFATYIALGIKDLEYIHDYKTIKDIQEMMAYIREHNKLPPLTKNPGYKDSLTAFRVILRASGAESHILATFD